MIRLPLLRDNDRVGPGQNLASAPEKKSVSASRPCSDIRRRRCPSEQRSRILSRYSLPFATPLPEAISQADVNLVASQFASSFQSVNKKSALCS